MKQRNPSNRKLLPLVLLATIVIAAGVAVYHALDSWYLQSANASRLRADYSEMAALRFSDRASQALANREAADAGPLLAQLFDSVRLLPRGVPTAGGNAATFAMEVRDSSGRMVFRSEDPASQPFIAKETIAGTGLVVSVAARKSAVAWLATEHLASRMMLILWLIGLTAVAALLAMRVMRREARLAEARTDFVSSVSHELRTPLAQIQILLETLRLGRFNTEAQREWTLEGMQREVTRLTTLVNNVLRFSSSERTERTQSVHPRETDLAGFLRDVVDGFRPLAAARHVTIETRAPSEMTLWIDPDPFRQVLLNLLDNAVKYGPVGQMIGVAAVQHGAVAQISVTDQGAGIVHADRQRIWNAFERGSNVQTLGVAGSGIGLAVAQDIVRAHGGTLRLDEPFKTGARFIIELPNAVRQNDRRRQPSSAGTG